MKTIGKHLQDFVDHGKEVTVKPEQRTKWYGYQPLECDSCIAQGCKGKVRYEDEDGYIFTWLCQGERRENCQHIEEMKRRRRKNVRDQCGMPQSLQEKSMHLFSIKKPYQRQMKNVMSKWHKLECDDQKPWLLFCGESGSGKTHAASSAANYLLDQGKQVFYIRWSELMNLTKYGTMELLDKCKKVPVLFLDDLYKGPVSPAELKATAELIDYRYNAHLQTLVTTERYQQELIREIDEATVSRIVQRSKGCFYVVPKDESVNTRMAEFMAGGK